MNVRDILNIKGGGIFALSPDQSVSEAMQVIFDRDIGSVLVMREGRLAGLITQRDMLKAVAKSNGNPGGVAIEDAMTRDLVVCSPEDSVDYARSVMTERHISHLPVVEGDNLVGIISFHDIAKAMIKAMNFENMALKRYIKDWPAE
jgi:CBS domain-containing protein